MRASRRIFLASCCLAAAACSRSDAPAPAVAGKTQAPPVLPSPQKRPAFLRDHYVKLDDCAYDWGSAQKCRSVPAGSSAQQTGANFFGPIYAKGYREETQAQLRREAIAGGYAAKVGEEASDRSSARSEVAAGAN
jgi:hypothetical protein